MENIDGNKLAYKLGMPAAAGHFLAQQFNTLWVRVEALENRVAELETLNRIPPHLRDKEDSQATPQPSHR